MNFLSSLLIPKKNIAVIVIKNMVNDFITTGMNSFSKNIKLLKTRNAVIDIILTNIILSITCLKNRKIERFKHF